GVCTSVDAHFRLMRLLSLVGDARRCAGLWRVAVRHRLLRLGILRSPSTRVLVLITRSLFRGELIAACEELSYAWDGTRGRVTTRLCVAGVGGGFRCGRKVLRPSGGLTGRCVCPYSRNPAEVSLFGDERRVCLFAAGR